MDNKNSEIYDIDPYIDSFSFFLDNIQLKQKFSHLNNELQNDEETKNFYSDYIKEIISNIKISSLDENETRDEKLIFYKNPKIAFDLLLNELHKIYGGKEEYRTKIISKELNKESAYNLFKTNKDNDKSYISDNFFGIKLIEKKCEECNMTQYNYKYLKTIPIKVSDVGDNKILDIETHLKKIQRKFPMEEFCPMCSAKKKTENKS
jgi:ubiquitin C-terminal hydrolase